MMLRASVRAKTGENWPDKLVHNARGGPAYPQVSMVFDRPKLWQVPQPPRPSFPAGHNYVQVAVEVLVSVREAVGAPYCFLNRSFAREPEYLCVLSGSEQGVPDARADCSHRQFAAHLRAGP